MPYSQTRIATGLFLGILFLIQPLAVSGDTVKTYYKQYSIFTFKDQNYLCEPYLVKKDDWLYKIFRKKGEISLDDFPRFLKIFRQLNPKLSNIDAIEPGHQILIPLRKISRDAFEEKQKGVVEVPVLEFSSEERDERLAQLIQEHTIQRGDTVSTLLARAYRKKGGAVSETGKMLFKKLNPDIRDINKIYLGSRVLIPDPALLDEPWFNAFMSMGKSPILTRNPPVSSQAQPSLPAMAPEDLVRLKRYTQLVQGALAHQGQMVFPGKGGRPPLVLDLSKTPVMTGPKGEKTLILPPETTRGDIDPNLVEGMKAYWKDLQIQELNKALAALPMKAAKALGLNTVPRRPDHIIKKVLADSSYTLQTETPVKVQVGGAEMEVAMARITHPDRPDLLVNPARIYGQGLSTLEAKGHRVLTLSPGMTCGEILLLLFSKLDYSTWKNPAFNANGRVTSLKGLYASRQGEKRFVTLTPLNKRAADFLSEEGIKAIELKRKDIL